MTKLQDLTHQQACAVWSNRILLLALLGILYLTLFPFEFHFTDGPELRTSLLLLGPSVKASGPLDFFLNILLFVPFGFGVCTQAGKRGLKSWQRFLLALALGAAASYTVEFLQLFIPQRDSGWTDIISNSLGSVVGFALFELAGGTALKGATRFEAWFEGGLSPGRMAILLVAYFAAAFGLSAILQRETKLSDWYPQSPLIVGNDAAGKNPWRGSVSLVQIWNRALRERDIRRIAVEKAPSSETTGMLAEYDLADSATYADRLNLLPALAWTPGEPRSPLGPPAQVDARSWLSTKVPAENLVREIQKTNQFTVHVICAPAAPNVGFGRIVSLSQAAENVNFHLRQDRGHLVFYFRTPLAEKRSVLAWYVPSVFYSDVTRDIFAIYDGSDAFIYIDGKRADRTYRLSPGAALLHSFSSIQMADLDGYVTLYETLVFLPAGMLIGVAARKYAAYRAVLPWLVAAGWLLPAVLLEVLLSLESGRQIWIWNIALALLFGVAGALLVNTDERSKSFLRAY